MGKLKNLLSREMLINYVFIFYIVSIILDLHIFYNSISTLIRVVFISVLFLIIFIKYANNKERKLLLIYFIFLLLYILIHLWNSSIFEIPFKTDYSNLSEILYFIKMLMNVFIIFIIYKLEIDKDKFLKLITVSAFLISGSIVICNLFEIGYTSYDFTTIDYSIFDWFKYESIDFSSASSKGYFHFTNQISAILILYLPMLLINLKEKIRIFNVVTILFVIISLYMLGTRVSSYSPFIILILTLIIYLITSFIENKFNKKYILLILLLLIISYSLYNFCPLLNRNSYYSSIFSSNVGNIENDENTEYKNIYEMSDEEFKNYLKNYNIIPAFYNRHYPLENDREFYENYINLDTVKINDTRFLELQVIKRVKYLNNNNKLDNYFGIGYDRVINIFNIESDYIMQYYSIGIIGTILILGINIVLLIYMYFKTLFNLKRYFTFENIMLMFSASYFLASSYFTGNILNSISCIIPVSFVIGFNLSRINKKESLKNDEYYLGFKTSTKDIEEIVRGVFKEKEQTIIYNINPLIVNNFLKNNKVKTEFNKGKYNIPDGNGVVLVSKLISNNIRESIPGIELMENICKESIKNKYSIYLYGAKEDSVSKAKIELEKKYKNINIVGYKNGYTKEEIVVKDILDKKPDILFVALGSPLQEEFIIRNKKKFKDIKIIMPVGGSFDVISKNLKRAPEIFRKLKLEWLYRMIREPKRFKQIFSLIKFVLLVLFVNFWYNEED